MFSEINFVAPSERDRAVPSDPLSLVRCSGTATSPEKTWRVGAFLAAAAEGLQAEVRSVVRTFQALPFTALLLTVAIFVALDGQPGARLCVTLVQVRGTPLPLALLY